MISRMAAAPGFSPSPAELYGWIGTWGVIVVLGAAVIATARMIFGVGVGLIDNPPPEPVRRRRAQRVAVGTALDVLLLLATYPVLPEVPNEWFSAPMQSPRDLYMAITLPVLSFTWIVLTAGTAAVILVLVRIATGPFGEAQTTAVDRSAVECDVPEKECRHG